MIPSRYEKVNNRFVKRLFRIIAGSELGFKFRTICVSEILAMVNDIKFRSIIANISS